MYGKKIAMRFLIILGFLLGLNAVIGFLSHSFSIIVIAIIAFLYFIEGVLIFYVIKRVIEGYVPRKNPSYIMLGMDTIIAVIIAIEIYFAYNSIHKAVMVRFPYASFITPLITLSFSAFYATKIEDALRMMIVYNALALFAIIINLLTVYWLDPSVAILIGLIGLRENIIRGLETVKGLRGVLLEETIESMISAYREAPVIKDVRDIWLGIFSFYCYGGCKVLVSPLLTDNELDELRRYLIRRTIHTVPYIIAIHLVIERVKETTIKIAIPVRDTGIVASFDETSKFVIEEVSIPEIKPIKREKLELEVVSGRILQAQKANQLISKGVEVLLTKDIGDVAESSFRGWFTKIYRVKKENIREVFEEYVKTLRSMLQ